MQDWPLASDDQARKKKPMQSNKYKLGSLLRVRTIEEGMINTTLIGTVVQPTEEDQNRWFVREALSLRDGDLPENQVCYGGEWLMLDAVTVEGEWAFAGDAPDESGDRIILYLGKSNSYIDFGQFPVLVTVEEVN